MNKHHQYGKKGNITHINFIGDKLHPRLLASSSFQALQNRGTKLWISFFRDNLEIFSALFVWNFPFTSREYYMCIVTSKNQICNILELWINPLKNKKAALCKQCVLLENLWHHRVEYTLIRHYYILVNFILINKPI